MRDKSMKHLWPYVVATFCLVIAPATSLAQLQLNINSVTGAGSIQNVGGSSLGLVSYQIDSSSASLAPITWLSLQDQGHPGWVESLATTSALWEVALGSPMLLGSGGSISVGIPFDVADPQTVTFMYGVEGSGLATGNVVFSPVPEPAGLALLGVLGVILRRRR